MSNIFLLFSHLWTRVLPFLLLAIVGRPRTALGQAGTIDPSFAPGPATLAVSKMALQGDGKIIIAGMFTNFGTTAISNLARLNIDGTLDTTFNPGLGLKGQPFVPPAINTVAAQSDGNVLVGGTFVEIGGIARTNIARLNANGSLDTSFNAQPDNTVNALVPLANGKMCVGGAFTKIGGTARKSVALLNTDGTVDASFIPNWGTLFGGVSGIATQSNGKIVVVGNIGKLVGVTPTAIGIARFNADGSLDTTLNGQPLAFAQQSFTSVAIQNDGKIIVGGLFTSIGGQARSGIARLNADGTLDTTWTATGVSGGVGSVYAIRLQADGKALIAGYFSSYNGTPRTGVVRCNSDGTLDTTFANPLISSGFGVAAMELQTDGKVLIAGGFSQGGTISSILRVIGDSSSSATAPVITTQPIAQTVNAGANAIFTVAATGSTALTYQWRLNGTNIVGATNAMLTVSSVVQTNGGLYTVVVSNAGGSVTSQSALLNPVSPAWPDLSFPNTGTDPLHVNALYRQADGKILVAGVFTKVGGFTRNLVARLNADGSVDTSFDQVTRSTPELYAVAAQSSGKPIIAGSVSGDGVNFAALGRLNLNGSLDSSFNVGTGPDDAVFALAVQSDDRILIGGFFGRVSGVARPAIARLNVNGDLDNGFVPNVQFPQVISAIAIQSDGKILIGGKTGGSIQFPQRNLIRLDTNGLIDPTFNPGTGPNLQVRSIVVQGDGKSVIGGEFSAVNGTPRNGVARINTDGSLDSTFNPPQSVPSAFVWSVAVQSDGKVVVGGAFEQYGGVTRKKIVRLNTDGSVDATFAPADGANNAEIKAVLVLPDGKILAGGDFTSYDGFTFNRLVRLHGGGGAAVMPTLLFSRSVSNLTLAWSDPSFILQSNANLTSPNWMDVPGGSPQTIPTGSGQGYHRLIKR
jgi:uncharacterized delta-60 repeat protein